MAGRGKAAAAMADREADGDVSAARPAFDLCHQPWIPVVRGGVEELVSLRAAVTEAHQIDGLSTTDGPRFAGLLRLLVALVMDAYGQPANDREWAARRERGRLDAATLDDYVAAVGQSRFDLFDAAHPFMQSASTPDEGKSIAELLPHVAAGNRVPLFTPDTDATPRPLSYAQAAQALVAAQAVAVPSPGRPRGDEPRESWAGCSLAGRVGITGFCCPVGDTLFDTVMLNLPNGAHRRLDPADLPVWRRVDAPHARRKRFSEGVADMLTWTPRRVRLLPQDGVVSRVGFRGGDALPHLDVSHEPHTALRLSDGKGKGDNVIPAGQWYPRKHQKRSLGWRGLPQLLALGDHRDDTRPASVIRAVGDRLELLPPDYRVTVFSLFVEFGNMSAVVEDIDADVYPLPVRAFGENETDLRDFLVDVVATADRVGFLVAAAAEDVHAATRRDLQSDPENSRSTRKASKAYAAGIRAAIDTRVDSITRRLLSAMADSPADAEPARARWAGELRAAALDALDTVRRDCGPEVFSMVSETDREGRRVVAVAPPAIRMRRARRSIDDALGASAPRTPDSDPD